MTKAEQAALKAYTPFTAENLDEVMKARKLFVKGYEQAEKDLGWISVKDRLPKPNHFVITCSDDNGTPQAVMIACLLDNKWWDGENYVTAYVDYWMEVPKLKK